MNTDRIGFCAAEILLPDFRHVSGTRWATVACDQFTSEPAYWEQVEQVVADAPSTLRMILPEAYLEQAETRVPAVNRAMQTYLNEHLVSYPNAMVYLERKQSDGKIRKGLVACVDLEQYDFHAGARSLIRATEGTVLERIPPRVAIRRDAPLELPHIMLLIDDPHRTVIEPLRELCQAEPLLYDFDLMEGGGHVRGTLLPASVQEAVCKALAELITPNAIAERYGDASLAPLLFAVGDGNHSLAAAKATYEEIRDRIGVEAAKSHPARYALAEIVNLHDDALSFEPIYRVVFHCDPQKLIEELKQYCSGLHGTASSQQLRCMTKAGEEVLEVPHPEQQLAVGTLQSFLFRYASEHPEITVDYIHGEDSLRNLSARENAIGFLFDGMRKDELFRTVIYDGALPRKTFSMGHARDKRYYLECRKIK